MTPYQFELLKSLKTLADLLSNMSDEEFNERYEKRKASLEQERALDKLLKDGGGEMKAYKCPDCGDRVVLSHDDYVWECEGCPNEFLGTPTWLEAYVSE